MVNKDYINAADWPAGQQSIKNVFTWMTFDPVHSQVAGTGESYQLAILFPTSIGQPTIKEAQRRQQYRRRRAFPVGKTLRRILSQRKTGSKCAEYHMTSKANQRRHRPSKHGGIIIARAKKYSDRLPAVSPHFTVLGFAVHVSVS